MRVLLPLVFILAPSLAAASCTGTGGADICNMARMAGETLNATLPQELSPGVMLTDSAIEGARLDLMLNVAADQHMPPEGDLAAMACSMDALKALVAAGGSLRFMTGGRSVGTVTTCPEF